MFSSLKVLLFDIADGLTPEPFRLQKFLLAALQAAALNYSLSFACPKEREKEKDT
jgi:hypothetical protein